MCIRDRLKEVAKDRLVVMVTHNPELAEQYATRIVRLRDGVLQSDTAPFAPDDSCLLYTSLFQQASGFFIFLLQLFQRFFHVLTSFAYKIKKDHPQTVRVSVLL